MNGYTDERSSLKVILFEVICAVWREINMLRKKFKVPSRLGLSHTHIYGPNFEGRTDDKDRLDIPVKSPLPGEPPHIFGHGWLKEKY